MASSDKGPLLTFEDIRKAIDVVEASALVDRTNLLRVNSSRYGLVASQLDLYFKHEGAQNMGSFKIRGLVNQMDSAPPEVKDGSKSLITMSAGNYGRSFAYMCNQKSIKGRVLMPSTVPKSRVDCIKGYGLEVELMPASQLKSSVERYVKEEQMVFFHPFNDLAVIAGHCSLAHELYEDLGTIDIIIVGCGGGGLVSSVASYAKLSGRGTNTRIIAVEPEGACAMYLSLKEGHPVTLPSSKSVAEGLSAPFAGSIAYELVKEYVEEVVLVTDEEIKESVKVLYHNGLVVEAAGAAGLAALRAGKIKDVEGKKIVLVLCGSNVTPQELVDLNV